MNPKRKFYKAKPSKKQINAVLQWYAALTAAESQQNKKSNENEVQKNERECK
ncbi:MAG: hypothetical protein J6Y71_06900 [Ruminococcus sp.]|nr:hypothetical protein [Ruminococcus sp.]